MNTIKIILLDCVDIVNFVFCRNQIVDFDAIFGCLNGGFDGYGFIFFMGWCITVFLLNFIRFLIGRVSRSTSFAKSELFRGKL